MAAAWITSQLVVASAYKEALQRLGRDAGISKLGGGAASRGESLDRIAALLCALPNGF
jgi:hypothetical protein